MAKKNDWKKRDGVVYSTSSDFDYQYQQNQDEETLSPKQQNLRVSLDKHARAGKQVTLVTGFSGSSDDLEKLGKLIKTKCGVGGSVKDGEVVIQGDLRDKVLQLLIKEGYEKSKRGN
jgi:translation initiation factor 1